MRLYVDASPLVGRSKETALLNAAAREAAAGDPRVLLLHGEAGIGKTRLVSDVCARERAGGAAALWGQCINFGATAAPYVPLVSAFEDWLESASAIAASEQTRDAVEELVTALTGDALPGTARLLRLLDAALVTITKDQPMVLVVDDVQWCDTSTLDLLAYMLATLRPRRLLVLVTYRDTELPDGHHLHGWLADAGRLPGVCDLRLGRLTREETETQVAHVLGRSVPMSLIDEVLDRAAGNPYLTELLLREVPPDATSLPEGMPNGLRTALLAAWHRLGSDARQLTRLLATAQKPLAMTELQMVAQHLGLRGDLATAVEESSAAGVMVRGSSGDLWFHHPLLAEVLYEDIPLTERHRLHAAFVAALEHPGPVEPRLAAHLALHAERADMPDRAFRYALVAADHAASVNALPEEAEQRIRAAQLWQSVSADVRKKHRSQSRLWSDAASAASEVGWDRAATSAAESARTTSVPALEPATAARALRIWAHLRPAFDRDGRKVQEAARDAARLSAASDDTEEHAICLADLADTEVWSGDMTAAQEHAQQAVQVAEHSKSTKALAWAFAARAFACIPSEEALGDAEKAYRLAIEAGDAHTFSHASITRTNVLEGLHRFNEIAEAYERAYAFSVQRGFSYQQHMLAAYTIAAMMNVGRYDDARRMLRLALAVPGSGYPALSARLNGVYLELCQGDIEAANRHLERAREIAPNFETLPGQHGASLMAMYHLVSNRPDLALQPLVDHFAAVAPGELGYGDWLVLQAAIATGDLARATRRRPSPDLAGSRAALSDLLEARRALGGEMFDPVDGIAQAHRCVLQAELARAFGRDDEVDRWRGLADIPQDCGEVWIMTRAILHWAQSLLDARVARSEIAVPLQRAYDRSQHFGFRLLLAETENLGQRARIPLKGATAPPKTAESLAGLTPREREVLDLLADGDTYAKIAGALFISQKTVSVHVSHILQKTKTSSRSEAAAWAWHNQI